MHKVISMIAALAVITFGSIATASAQGAYCGGSMGEGCMSPFQREAIAHGYHGLPQGGRLMGTIPSLRRYGPPHYGYGVRSPLDQARAAGYHGSYGHYGVAPRPRALVPQRHYYPAYPAPIARPSGDCVRQQIGPGLFRTICRRIVRIR